jgi:hypothetical protein
MESPWIRVRDLRDSMTHLNTPILLTRVRDNEQRAAHHTPVSRLLLIRTALADLLAGFILRIVVLVSTH